MSRFHTNHTQHAETRADHKGSDKEPLSFWLRAAKMLPGLSNACPSAADGNLRPIMPVLRAGVNGRFHAGLEEDDDIGSPEEEVAEFIAFEQTAAGHCRHIDG